MNWTRAGQLTGETQAPAEYDLAGILGGSPTFDTNPAYANTGNCSYRYGAAASVDAVGVAFAAADQVRANFWLNHNAPATSTNFTRVFQLTGGDALECGLITVAGTTYLRLRNGASATLVEVDAAGTGITATGAWLSIGVVYLKDVGVYVYVNGVLALAHETAGDVDWQPTGFYFGRVTVTSSWANYAYFDDLYVDIGSGNDVGAPPSRRFLPAFPNGAGASTDWAPNAGANYAAVDDAPPDDNTTYVKADGSNLTDTYTCTDVTVPTDYAVRAVIIAPYARKTDAGVAATLRTVAVLDTDETASAAQGLTTAYGYIFDRLELAPDGAAWTEAKVNAAEYGIESAGVYA